MPTNKSMKVTKTTKAPKKTAKSKTLELDPKLFWDVEYPNITQQKTNYFYIIERAMLKGSSKDITQIESFYTKTQIRDVIEKSKQLSFRTKQFYNFHYNLKLDNLCLQEQSSQKLWQQ